MVAAKLMTPEEELRDLCDLSVVETIAIVSEFIAGAEYFQKADAETLLKFLPLAQLTGLIIEGMAGLHRPGILNDIMTFYNRSDEEMYEHLERVPRHQHVRWIFGQILDIQKEWLGKFKEAFPPDFPIIFSADSDDFHGTAERMLRVVVQSHAVKVDRGKKALEKRLAEVLELLNGTGKNADLQEKIRLLRIKRDEFAKAKKEKLLADVDKEIAEINAQIADRKEGLLGKLARLESQRETFKGEPGKQAKRDKLDKQIAETRAKIEVVEERIEKIQLRIVQLKKRFSYAREPETNPVYQRFVHQHVEGLYAKLHGICDDLGITLVTRPDILTFGTAAIDYAHDRGRTWTPMPGRVKRLPEAYHGIIMEHRENVEKHLATLKDVEADKLDFVVESGHHGVGFARWQKLRITDEEAMSQHVNTVYTGKSDDAKHMTYVAAIPFENQKGIAKYASRRKPARTRAGKTNNSANHPLFQRYDKGGVSGITILRKHRHEITSVEFIMYALFENKDVLKPFKAVLVVVLSDDHFDSPEQDLFGVHGAHVLTEYMTKNPLRLYGTDVYAEAVADMGDAGESDSKRWTKDNKPNRMLPEVMETLPGDLAALDPASYEAILKASIVHYNDMAGGSNENMAHTADMVDWHLRTQMLTIWKSPKDRRLRNIMFFVTGNHFDERIGGTGFQEDSFFERWVKTLKRLHEDCPWLGIKPIDIELNAGGEPRYFKERTTEPELEVITGGYSVARDALMPKFGVGADGKLHVNAPCRIYGIHDPGNFVGSARNAEADIAWKGHTHESCIEIDKAGEGKGRFLDTNPNTQRVSPTEKKYGGLPRSPGVDIKVISSPDRYMKMTIPMPHMRRIGYVSQKLRAKVAVEKHQGKVQGKQPQWRKRKSSRTSEVKKTKKRAVQKRRVIGKKVKGGRHGKKRV